MNLSALTAKEVLRICAPETDLEKRLFDICNELEGEAQEAKEDADQARRELDNDDSISSDDWSELVRAVRSAIENIESGKVDDAKKILEKAI